MFFILHSKMVAKRDFRSLKLNKIQHYLQKGTPKSNQGYKDFQIGFSMCLSVDNNFCSNPLGNLTAPPSVTSINIQLYMHQASVQCPTLNVNPNLLGI